MPDLGEQRVSGAFNGTAPPGGATMREVLEAAAATGPDAELVWIPDERLVEKGVEPWTELPLWLRDGGEGELDEWRSEHRRRPMTSQREQELIG